MVISFQYHLGQEMMDVSSSSFHWRVSMAVTFIKLACKSHPHIPRFIQVEQNNGNMW